MERTPTAADRRPEIPRSPVHRTRNPEDGRRRAHLLLPLHRLPEARHRQHQGTRPVRMHLLEDRERDLQPAQEPGLSCRTRLQSQQEGAVERTAGPQPVRIRLPWRLATGSAMLWIQARSRFGRRIRFLLTLDAITAWQYFSSR